MSVSGIHGQLLEVTVVECNKLKDTEWISRQDPYVCLEYGTSKFRTRTCTDGGKNPIFQEKFVFTLIEGLREISVVVWNSNNLTYDDFIGSGRILLEDVLRGGYDDRYWSLQSKTGRHSGKVKLIMHYANATANANNTFGSRVSVTPSAPPYLPSPQPEAPMYSMPHSNPMPAYPPTPTAAYPPYPYSHNTNPKTTPYPYPYCDTNPSTSPYHYPHSTNPPYPNSHNDSNHNTSPCPHNSNPSTSPYPSYPHSANPATSHYPYPHNTNPTTTSAYHNPSPNPGAYPPNPYPPSTDHSAYPSPSSAYPPLHSVYPPPHVSPYPPPSGHYPGCGGYPPSPY